MNIWAIVAVIAALVFGFCMGYIAADIKEREHVNDLLKLCEETSNKLSSLSKEYDEFIKSANEIDHWPKNNAHIVMKDSLADYLKAKYLSEETEDRRTAWIRNNEVDPECDDDFNDDDEYDGYV